MNIHHCRVVFEYLSCQRFISKFSDEMKIFSIVLSSVRDGVFRQFNGERSLNGLKSYIEYRDWTRTTPISPYFAPDSLLYVQISPKLFNTHLSLFDISECHSLVKFSMFLS